MSDWPARVVSSYAAGWLLDDFYVGGEFVGWYSTYFVFMGLRGSSRIPTAVNQSVVAIAGSADFRCPGSLRLVALDGKAAEFLERETLRYLLVARLARILRIPSSLMCRR